jgi:hypothetical protein
MGNTLFYNSTPQYTLVASNTGHALATGGTVTVTGIPATTKLIVIVIGSGATSPSFTDSSGNTYVYTTAYGSGIFTRQGYIVNPTTTSSMTFTITATAWSVWVGCFTCLGTPTPALDVQNGNNGINQSSFATGSITPTVNGDLIIASAATITANDAPAAVSGYTLVHLPFLAGNYQGLVLYYKAQQYIQAENVTFTGTSMHYTGCMIAGYKP